MNVVTFNYVKYVSHRLSYREYYGHVEDGVDVSHVRYLGPKETSQYVKSFV
jgi:hypothetical protein